MEWTGLNELREKFLKFFESKGHLRLQSFSLIPKEDNSLLLINSGMAPMKKYFTGELIPPKTRITTCQKCIRTPDIERVGITSRHGTYFEMLGNFSFGDYFKNEIIPWAWEFCTDILELPKDKLWISIYENDDEAFEIWTKEVKVDPSHIVRLGKEDNFWEHGVGPCGPCSEIYFDRGEKYGCGSESCGVGCDCDRYIEFWNLVFTQFNNDGNNNYTPLEQKNIDTGMGLERLACIMQNVDNLFLVDTVQNIMNHICKIAGVKYGKDEKTDISLRVITDHIRSVTFMIGDGVMPSNEGRGYVLRRLLRRAARHGRLISISKPFLSDLCETVIKENENAYPELREKATFIKKLISVEEENFSNTIDQGLEILNDYINKADSNVISGDVAFKLNDTYGFPIDLTKEILSERNMIVDEDKFNKLMSEQKNRARNAREAVGESAWDDKKIDLSSVSRTKFIGYDNFCSLSQVIGIIKDNEFVSKVNSGEKAFIILDKTPFYAQSGGQAGDSGFFEAAGMRAEVIDTTKNLSSIYFHNTVVTEGTLSCGDKIEVTIDKIRREKTARNHTAAHLLQAALRKVLGDHVEQAGQMVNDKEVRFDFTHFSALTKEQISKVEKIINDEIFDAADVIIEEMPIEQAKKLGAMALFGEKYGKKVRVVNVNNYSIELCGGTHVNNTSKLGLFKIISESSVASGVRRIEAVTATGVLDLLNDYIDITSKCQEILKVNKPNELIRACDQFMSNAKNNEKIIKKLNSDIAKAKVSELINEAKDINNLKIIVKRIDNVDVDTLKYMCDTIKDKIANSVTIISCVNGEKANIIVSTGKEAIDMGIKSGNLAKSIAQLTGGNGGGRPDMAMAGIKDISKLEYAMSQSEKLILSILS